LVKKAVFMLYIGDMNR